MPGRKYVSVADIKRYVAICCAKELSFLEYFLAVII